MPVAFVIGGARRLGGNITRSLAQAGYDVGITYHTSSSKAETLVSECMALGRTAVAVQCNVTSEQDGRAAWSTLTSKLGVPDVLVVCAGVFFDKQDPRSITAESMAEAFAVNTIPLVVFGAMYAEACDAAGTTGRLISIGSLGAHEIWMDRLRYNTSKAAAHTAALSLARSLAPTIAVNIVAPAAISVPDDPTASDESLIPTTRIPMQRHGTADDVASAVMFFASCSRYITGQTIHVDGGYGLTR